MTTVSEAPVAFKPRPKQRQVLRYQRDLTDAQVRELRALVDYQIALTALQKSTFTIVSDNDIVLAKKDSTTN